MVCVFLADGFEELEALAPVDILRRGGIKVKTVGVTGKVVNGAHGIPVTADVLINELNTSDISAVILPGGMPGTTNLENNPLVQEFINFAAQSKLILGAICAAPSILGHKGLLNGKKAVCFPGFENELIGAQVLNGSLVRDGNIITARGAGVASEFGFALLDALDASTKSGELRRTMCYID